MCLFSYVVRPTIVLIIGHFSVFAKFCEILQKYQNSAEKGKFRSSARNSATHGKLWALIIGGGNRTERIKLEPLFWVNQTELEL